LYEKHVKQKRVEVNKKLKYQKEQKKNRIELAKITATVDSHGGICTSEAHIDHLIQQCQNITAKKTALRNHIMYYKLVSKTTGCEKRWFCLSLHVKPCSIEQFDPNYWTSYCGMLSNDNNETSLVFTHSRWHQFYSKVKWLKIILSLDFNCNDKYLPWLGVHFEVCQKLYVYFFLVNTWHFVLETAFK